MSTPRRSIGRTTRRSGRSPSLHSAALLLTVVATVAVSVPITTPAYGQAISQSGRTARGAAGPEGDALPRTRADFVLGEMENVLAGMIVGGPQRFRVDLTAEGVVRPFDRATLSYERVGARVGHQDDPYVIAVDAHGSGLDGGDAVPDPLGLSLRLARSLKGHALYVGLQEMDGSTVHVLLVDDVDALVEVLFGDGGTGAGTGVVYIEEDTYVLRGVTAEIERAVPGGQQTTSEGSEPLKAHTFFDDWRRVGDLLYPHEMTSSLTGGVSERERTQARKLQRALLAQAGAVPPQSRRALDAIARSLTGMAMGTVSLRLTVLNIAG